MAAKHVVSALIEHRAGEHPDRVFLRMRAGERTWADFHADTLRVANALCASGVQAGERIAVMLPNCLEFLAVYFGIIAAGCAPVPLNTAQRGDTLGYLLRDSGVRAIVIDAPLYPQYQPVRAPGIVEIVRDASSGGAIPGGAIGAIPIPSGAIDLADVLRGPAAEPPPPETAQTSLGVLYTSGTTGPPKGVVPMRTDIEPLLAIWQAMDVRAGETLYTCLPLFHGNPLAFSVLGAMFLDASVAVSERFSARAFWDEVRAFDAVEFNHVGAIIPILLAQPARADDGDNPVRTVLSAGCPPTAWEPFQQRFGVRILEQFSMVDSPGYLINTDGVVGSMGKPAPKCEATILAADGAELPAGQVGELALRAAEGRTHAYLNQPEETERAFRDGWFHTGDLAWRDADGYFFYAGRKKESMRRRGENVSAWEVENVVNAFPGVQESAAHTVPSELGEDEIKIVVVPVDGARIERAELIAFCEARMARYAVPRYVEVRAELPKTPTQRPRYAELKAQGITPATWDRDA